MKFPFFFENSKVPVLLSYIAPINIEAISLGVFVFSRGTMDDQLKNHETIHYHQWVELCFIGFAILYPLFWLVGLFRYRDGSMAYAMNPFEIEAYENDNNLDYLAKRRLFSWRQYL